jgi:hypothetical protein
MQQDDMTWAEWIEECACGEGVSPSEYAVAHGYTWPS